MNDPSFLSKSPNPKVLTHQFHCRVSLAWLLSRCLFFFIFCPLNFKVAFLCFQDYCLVFASLVLFFKKITNNDLSLEQTINKNKGPGLLTSLAAQNNGSQYESIKEHRFSLRLRHAQQVLSLCCIRTIRRRMEPIFYFRTELDKLLSRIYALIALASQLPRQ